MDRGGRQRGAGRGGDAVVVTGASAGVGRATAVEFARRGGDVALIARGERGLAGAAEEVRRAGGRALVVPADVADAGQVRAAARRVEEELGPIAVWVNTAFSAVLARFADVTPEEYRRATEVTYLGYVYGTMAALEHMRPRDRGVVVQVGSALAYRGIPLQTAYCGAKHAVQGFHEALRCELRHEGSAVRTTMVQLPAVNTPQFSWQLNRMPHRPRPVPPTYRPELAARAVVWAADHPRRREHWVGTSTALTLLGNAVVPAVLDRWLARTGYAAQQTGEPADPDAPGNLWAPADGPEGRDFGVHGRFETEARGRDPQVWLSRHRGLVLLGVAGAAAAGALARRTRSPPGVRDPVPRRSYQHAHSYQYVERTSP